MTGPIVLVPVADEIEERRLLSRFDPGGIVPVIDRDGAVERLHAALSRHRVPHVITDDRDRGSVRSGRVARRAVIELGEIDPGIATLARHLFGDDGEAEPPAAALVLLDPRHTQVETVRRRIAALRDDGCAVGVVPILDGRRDFLLRTLLVDRVAVAPARVAFFGAAPGAPAVFAAPANRPEDADLLVLSGHSNMFDMSLGHRAVCGRLADERGGRRRLPCYDDDYCRVLGTGRGAGDATRLIDPSRLDASLVLLSGCNVFAPGSGVGDPGTGIISALLRSMCVASVVSIGLRRLPMEYDLLLLSLLARGRSLGEAWLRVDEIERQFANGGRPRSNGSSIVIGNPALRVDGIPYVAAEHSSIDVTLDERFGVLLDVPVRPGETISLEHEGAPIWQRGIRDGDRAILWTHGSVGDVQIEVVRDRRSRHTPRVAAFRRLLETIPFWDAYMHAFAGVGTPGEASQPDVAAWTDGLADLRHRGGKLLSRSLEALGPVAIAPLDPRVDDFLHQEIAATSESLFEQVSALARRHGLMHFHIWEVSYRLIRVAEAVRPCACGRADRDAHVWEPAEGGRHRWVYECPRCGQAGEDGGDDRVRVVSYAGEVLRGSTMTFELEISAPPDEVVHVTASALLEFWRHADTIMAEPQVIEVPAGERHTLRCELPVPAGAPRGLYAAGVVAIVNGSLAIERQVVELTDLLTCA